MGSAFRSVLLFVVVAAAVLSVELALLVCGTNFCAKQVMPFHTSLHRARQSLAEDGGCATAAKPGGWVWPRDKHWLTPKPQDLQELTMMAKADLQVHQRKGNRTARWP